MPKVISPSPTSLSETSCLFPQVPFTDICKTPWEAHVYLQLGPGPLRNPRAEQKLRGTAGAGLPTTGLNTSFSGAIKNHLSRAMKAEQSLFKSERRCVFFLGYTHEQSSLDS